MANNLTLFPQLQSFLTHFYTPPPQFLCHRDRIRLVYWPVMILFCFLFPATVALAQSSSAPVALKGSYASSVSDGVDMFSGKLEQVMPLLSMAFAVAFMRYGW